MSLYDPDKIFAELERAAEERASAEYEAHLLEKQGEILLAHKMLQAKHDGQPIGLCKEHARTTPEWELHIQGETEAIRKRSWARAHYNNLQILAEARRSQEATNRALTR